MTDRATAQKVLAALGATPVGDAAVLVGSSGLFGFDTQVSALAEGYAGAVQQAEAGLERLLALLERIDG